MKQPTLAAIDLGTNSCRLLIADRSAARFIKTPFPPVWARV